MMGGSVASSASRRFVDSIERACETRISSMKRVYEADSTPALKERIEQATDSCKERIKALRVAHEKFEKMMESSDDELRIANSNERLEPLFGDPEIVEKIRRRAMNETEYIDLTEGPTIIIRLKEKNQ